jgi:hypothetical protein
MNVNVPLVWTTLIPVYSVFGAMPPVVMFVLNLKFLTVVTMQNIILWDVTPCSSIRISLTFQRNILHPSLGWKSKPRSKLISQSALLMCRGQNTVPLFKEFILKWKTCCCLLPTDPSQNKRFALLSASRLLLPRLTLRLWRQNLNGLPKRCKHLLDYLMSYPVR